MGLKNKEEREGRGHGEQRGEQQKGRKTREGAAGRQDVNNEGMARQSEGMKLHTEYNMQEITESGGQIKKDNYN